MTWVEKTFWAVAYGAGLLISYGFLLLADARLKRRFPGSATHWFFSSVKFKWIRLFFIAGWVVLIVLIYTDQWRAPE